jgi:hypothetical protein
MTLFTENPLWAYVGLSILAVIFISAFFVTKRVIYLGALPILLVIGLGFWLIDYAIETDREQVERKTKELAAAVQSGDINKIDSLISAKFYRPDLTSKAMLMSSARAVLLPNQQRTAQLWQFEVKPGSSGKSITLTCNASATGQYGSFNVPSFLGMAELTYLKDDDGQWRLGKFRVTDTHGAEIAVPR